MIDEMIRREWREIVETVKSGTNIVVSIDNRPEVAVIPYEDYLALQEQLEDLQKQPTTNTYVTPLLRVRLMR
jgi:prevent-host-death family protein